MKLDTSRAIRPHILFIFFFFLTFLSASAQVRHVRGIKSIEAGAGKSLYGTVFYAAYSNYFSNKVYGKYSVFYESGRGVGLKYRSIGADLSACYSIKPVKEFFYFNFCAGVTASNDQLTPAIKVFNTEGVPRNENYATMKFGVFGGVETETFIDDKFVFILSANQRYMFKENFGRVRFIMTAGIRYTL